MRAHREGEDWRVARPWKRCRAGASRHHKGCGRPAAVELNRRMRRFGRVDDCWWGYCELHSFGRVVRDGQVWWDPSEAGMPMRRAEPAAE